MYDTLKPVKNRLI